MYLLSLEHLKCPIVHIELINDRNLRYWIQGTISRQIGPIINNNNSTSMFHSNWNRMIHTNINPNQVRVHNLHRIHRLLSLCNNYNNIIIMCLSKNHTWVIISLLRAAELDHQHLQLNRLVNYLMKAIRYIHPHWNDLHHPN